MNKLTKIISTGIERGYSSHLISKLDSGKFVTHCDNRLILLSKEFAKAYWPGDVIGRGGHPDGKWWKYHLQQAVLEDDPVAYYVKNS